ncbi:prepilin-type N-terminal cleavage/methylation domain-containing protein [Bradyrhizobium sp. GCM10023182]|uniref:Prepilin-type N-terminal cleavage/methylation domain-containing protein n=1 Tax=Bradyrhizobium zhengyangense TaxID=2911009 RepID=A0ABS9M0P2_9BRAD|nr:prepilin-type N-terminal cleavage/methylation domain-containing protein [Bradyrhizobium zhengyangense]MCG2672813.1 prepilin-type N-terminal cleavage/methylation domain-containing protein [Bradyrhizobium zhengyangense]
MRAAAGREGERGLTLIELVVSLALLALLTGFIVGGLSTAIRAFDADRRNGMEIETNSAVESLRCLIASAMPTANPLQGGGVLFEGGREGMRFVSLSEGRALPGGLQDIRIRRTGGELILDVFGAPKDGERKSPLVSTVVLKGLRGVHFRYFGVSSAQADPAWRNDWIKAERLPLLVEVGFEFEEPGRNGPAAIVALRNQPGS